MSTKNPRSSRQPLHPDAATSVENDKPSGARALTVNVPNEVLNLAKTRASLEGTTMSAVVSEGLATYAAGLPGVLRQLGLDKPR